MHPEAAVTLLTTELESSNASNAELNDRLGELTSALAASNTSNAELTAQVAPLSAELNASEARNNKLSGEIAQLKAKLEALRANSEGDAELADRLAKLESDLEESNARNIQLSGQLAAVEFQLANATSERDDTNERSHDVQERLEKIQRRLASLEQESESPMHSPEVQRAIWAAAAHEALNRLTELVSGLSAPRVPLPPSKSTGDGASSSAKGSPQTSSERKASSKIPLPSKRGARGGRGGRGRNRRDPPSGSSSSSSFVREPQSTTKRRTKSPVSSATSQAQVQLLPTRYDPTSGYPQTMLQVLFDNEVAVMDREVAGLRATRSSSEPDFLGRIRDLQRRAEELRGYNSTNTVVNETLAEATKVLELLGGKLPAGDLQDDEERRECLISTLGVIDILKETATARGATQDDQANAVAEAVPQLDNILLKLTAIDRRGPVGQEVSDLGSALRRWSSTPDTDQPSFKDLEGLLYQFQQNLEVLLIQNQQEFPHDTRDVTLIERKLQALNQEMVEAQQVAEEYREYKEENGDKAVEDGPRDKLISLAIEVIENNEWTRPTALETLLQTAAEFIPGHTNMEKWRATIQKYLERFWQEIAKLDRKTGRFDELLAETQEHIENDKVLRNLAKLERHKAFLQQVKQRLHQALAEWETGSLRPLQEFVNNEAREADQRAQDLLTTLLLEAKATLKKPDSPSKEEGRQTVSTQEGGTQTSAPPARVDANTQTTAPARVDANTQTTAPTQTPPTPNPLNVANPHLDGVCFCTILQYILPGVYHRIVNGGCCSNGLMKNPTTDGKRSGTQPPRSTDTDGSTAATTAAVTCSGHHGHGRLAASGDFYTILCNIFTALIWFTALILYSPYDFALYGLSLAAILLTPVTLIWRYLKWFYACANYKFFEQGNELEAVRPPTDPRAHPTAKGPNGRPLYAPPKRLGYPGIALPAVPAPGRLVSFAIITWTVYVTLVYIATYYERLIWLGANDYTGGSSRFGVREYTRELIGGGGLRMVPYADWSVYSVDWRFLGDAVGDIWLVRWVHGLFYDTGMGALGVEYLDDLPRPSERQAGWFGKWD
ncbi:hypothetical protein QBC43DRAFT_75842 [Cladorrhinum sp. PSN259]|nr:hypothetical protein QBC43DRAFT_75842 [Cladorrhinum sp. PSN259]